MTSEDDRHAATNGHGDRHGAAEPFAPPARDSRLGANWMMLTAMAVVVLAVVVFLVALATD